MRTAAVARTKLAPIHLVFALAILNFAVTQASRVLLALYALDFGAQPLAVGAISATFSACPMLLAWQAGRIADRLGSRRPLVFGALVCGCGMLVPYLLPGLPSLFVAAAMSGLSFTFYTVSLQNLVGILGDAAGRAKRYSNYAMVVSFATFLGPLISGFSIDHIGFRTTCLLVAVLGLLPLLLLASFGGSLPGGRPPSGHAETLGGMLADGNVRRVLVTSSLVVSGTDLFQFYLPIYGHAIGLSASVIGIVLAMFALASVVVRLLLPWFLARLSAEKVLSYAFCIGAASLLLLPFFQGAVVLCFISFALGLGLGCGAPITLLLTYSDSPQGRSGEALGLRMTANHLARVIGPLVFGTIGSAFGLFPVFWTNALMMASGSLISGRGARGHPQRR
jgi:MFS family permease